MRGLGQGFTGKWGDEAIPYVTRGFEKVLGEPDDQGIPREYAAGDRYADQTAGERRDNQEAVDKYPGTFYSGQALGALPSAVATGGMAGEGVAANALLAGARGGLEGAGGGTEGNRAMGAAWGAGPSAVLGGLGAGVAKAAPYIKDLFKNGPPGGPPLAPAMATVGGEAAPEASEIARGAAAARGAGSQSAAELGGPVINRAAAARPGATKPPPRRAQQSMEQGRKLGPEETTTRTNAVPPPKGYGGDFKVPKDTGLPNVPHIDFGNNVEIAGVTPNIMRGATDAPRMARLMGRPAIHPGPTAVAQFDAETPIPPAARTGMEQRLPELTPEAVENFTQQFGKRKPAYNYPQDYVQDYVRDQLGEIAKRRSL